jgi:DHA2 family multidrug resistance protein-like MFS transporter
MTAIDRPDVAAQTLKPGTTSETTRPTNWRAVVTLSLATLIVASESSMAAFALPLISADLGVGASATAWVLLAYSLPLAVLEIPAGRWADRADVRPVFVVSLVALGLTSIVAALAPVFWVLMATRGLQGCAAALYSAIYLPLITVTVQEDQSGRAMSYISTIMLVGSMAIAPLGGFVAGTFGWREVFLIKAPLLLLVLWLGSRTLPAARTGDGATPRLPLPDRSLLWEALLIGGAITAALLAFDQVEGQ